MSELNESSTWCVLILNTSKCSKHHAATFILTPQSFGSARAVATVDG
jgi:hypothetical protein